MNIFSNYRNDEEFEYLDSLGLEGSLNDKQKSYLTTKGFLGSLTDLLAAYPLEVTFDQKDYTNQWAQTASGWSFTQDSISCTGSTSVCYMTVPTAVITDEIELSFDVTNYTSGSFQFSYSSGIGGGPNYSSLGPYLTSGTLTGNERLYIRSTNFIGSLENFTIRIL